VNYGSKQALTAAQQHAHDADLSTASTLECDSSQRQHLLLGLLSSSLAHRLCAAILFALYLCQFATYSPKIDCLRTG
jgi:hypothetical protein